MMRALCLCAAAFRGGNRRSDASGAFVWQGFRSGCANVATLQAEDSTHMNQFILHSSLDMVEKHALAKQNMYAEGEDTACQV